MTEKELIARRLAGGPGSGYKDLARVSGLPEMTVWKLLRGKVPGRAKPVPQVPKGPGKPYSDSRPGDDAASRAARNWFGSMWARVDRVEPSWRSVRPALDPVLRDSHGRLKQSVMDELDRKAAATDELIARQGKQRPTAGMTDQEYAVSEASMVLCGLPNPSGFRSGVKA